MTSNVEQALRELEDLYRRVEARLAPTADCRQCARCCHFAEFGHLLYASYLEALYLVRCEGLPAQPPAEDTCTYLEGTSCTARKGRALGCRVFFCEAAGGFDAEGHERDIAALKEITSRHGLPWQYRPLTQHLRDFASLESPQVQPPQENETFFP